MSGASSDFKPCQSISSNVRGGTGKVGFEVSELPSTNDGEHQVGGYKTRRLLVSMLKYAEPRINTRDTCHLKVQRDRRVLVAFVAMGLVHHRKLTT